MVPLDAAAIPGLNEKVNEFVSGLAAIDPHTPAFDAKSEDIRTMGDEDIRAAAEITNRLLQSPLRRDGEGRRRQQEQGVEDALELRRTVEDLDPSRGDRRQKLLGSLPFGNKLDGLLPPLPVARSRT